MIHLYRIFTIVIFIRVAVTFSSQDLESGDKTCYEDNSPHSNGVAPEDSLEKKENGECGLSTTERGNQPQLTEAFVKSGQEQEHNYNNEDGLDGDNDTCSLYMAESSISNAGLGVYTTRSLSKGEVLNFSEVLLTHVDLFTNMRMSQLFTETEARQYYEIINSTETDIGKDCVVLALNGMCEHDANIRTTECAQTCALHSSGFDVKKTLIFLQDQDDPRLCKHWAELDECTHNPNFMLQECAQSCTVFEYGLYEDIKQSRAQWLPSHFYWLDEGVGTHFEANDATTFLPGLGSLPNSHMGLVNLDLRGHTYDNAGYHRLKDVGVGAFSSRHNITFEVLQDVPAGMELFLNYGEQYFSSETRLLRHVPSQDDYLEADNILSEFAIKVQELQEGNENNDSTAASMYERLLESIDNPRLKNALPPNYQIIQQGKDKNAAMLSVPNVIRSSEWLKEYGMCIDRLYPGPSTVSQAGRGAFASRSIQNGQVIAHMPLLHMDREKLRRFVGAKEITPQLSINYSYGHESSSMVLLPYSPAVNFVNHNFDKSKVNAKLQWSSRSYHQQQWENDVVSEILQRQQSGLMMELVATQDIPQGHEVFLDYGGRWEEAWMAHVSNWTPPSDSYSIAYDNVEDLNHPENLEIRILEEQRDLPYGENVVIMCWLDVIKLFSNVRNGSDGDFQWEQFRVERSGTAQPATDNVTKKCEIVQRLSAPNDAEIDDMDDGDLKRTTLYTVSVKFAATGSKEFFIEGIPRSEIFFEHKKYASDQFLENAFRHVIDIPDEIFPAAWKDLEHGV